MSLSESMDDRLKYNANNILSLFGHLRMYERHREPVLILTLASAQHADKSFAFY